MSEQQTVSETKSRDTKDNNQLTKNINMEANFDYLKEFCYSQWLGLSLADLKAYQPSKVNYDPETEVLDLTLVLPFAWGNRQDLGNELVKFMCDHDDKFPPISAFNYNVEYKIKEHTRVGKQAAVRGVKNIIAISSAKGGVGKSSVAVNFAHALANTGIRVGILDADIYGPSIPHMLGVSDKQPTSDDQKTMNPVVSGKLVANSIGFLVGETDPTIWRGPVASSMLKQLMAETNWPNLDYLVIDMPPGTGDIQLTVAQNLSINAAIIVSTPQEIALLDVLKGTNMFAELDVPVLGVVENMSMFKCPQCGHQAHIFGDDGVKDMAELLNLPILASLPLDPDIGKVLDNGENILEKYPHKDVCQEYKILADNATILMYHSLKTAPSTINIKQL